MAASKLLMLPNSVPAAHHSKANTSEASVVRKERLLYSAGWQLGEKVDCYPTTNSELSIKGHRAFKGKFQRCRWREGLHEEQHSQL